MKPTHILGLGFVVGMAALGALLATVTFQWSEAAYPETAGVPGSQRPVRGGAEPASQEVRQGETIFKQKCSSCHTIGGGRLAGPDLRGIADQRPRDWLVSFIVEPDKVIASGDPVAAQLVEEYGVPMPNLGVTRDQAGQVLAFIDFQSGGGEPGAARATQPAGAPAGQGAPQATVAPAAMASPTPVAAVAAPAKPASAQGKALFDQKCAGCHTVGGGRGIGPDLKGISSQRPRDWLIRFTVEPDKVIASGDPTAAQLVREYGMPMPNVGVTSAQAEEILAYIDAQSGGAPAPEGAPATAPAAVQPGNADAGRALFIGQKPMANGGPACAACHNVAGAQVLGGGTWGLDLTHAQSKTGTAGLVSIMKTPPFPGMKEAYQDHPVTDAETADLAAFFIEVDRLQGAESLQFVFVPAGIMLFVVLALLSQWAWRNRTPSVWKQIETNR